MHGDIVSIDLVENGPKLKVALEIKNGQITHYDLNLDEAAAFIKENPQHPKLKKALGKLRFFEKKAIFSLLLSSQDNGNIELNKIVALPQTSSAVSNAKDFENFYIKTLNEQGAKYKSFKVVKFAKTSFSVGQRFLFVPKIGYFPTNISELNSTWDEFPLSKTLKEEEALNFLTKEIESHLKICPLLSKNKNIFNAVLHKIKIDKITIKSNKNGWFVLDPNYKAGDSNISMVELIKQVQKTKGKFIRSGDQWVEVPDYIREFNWQLDETNNFLKVDALGLHRLRAAIGEFDTFVGTKKALEEIAGAQLGQIETTPPPLNFTKLSLRPYQQNGYEWLWWLYQNKLHGLLADEMGLGKTHQAMAILSAILNENKDSKFLIIAPTTVLDHWLQKISEFSPQLLPVIYRGANRKEVFDSLNNYSTFITSYGVILRDIETLKKIEWQTIILDEAHYIKNNKTATYEAMNKINSKFRLCLSGTPIENRLQELKSIFDFLLPGFLGSDSYFNRNFAKPILQEKNTDEESELVKLLHPFKLRRIKSVVLNDLPEKVEDKIHCELSPEQVKVYQDILSLRANPLVSQLKEDSKVSYMHVFAVLNLLKQVCNHPALIGNETNYTEHESGKFELLKELLQQSLDSGHKVVIYSHYLKMIDIISDYLKSIEINHVTLTGKTQNRGAVVQKFQEDPNCKIYIGSLLAGGIGVDLTSASVVIHYDRWWNPSKENQATDRIHRIGQNKNVQVIKLITKGTLEERIDQLIDSKKDIFERFVDNDENIVKNFSRQELINLLS